MGMFDSIYVSCKYCGAKIEFQSKAGDCHLAEYSLRDAPPSILGDLDGESQWCDVCGTVNEIKVMMAACIV